MQAVTGSDFTMRFFVSLLPQIVGSDAEEKTEARRPLGTNHARSQETLPLLNREEAL